MTYKIICARLLGEKIIWLKDGRVFKMGDTCLVEEYFKDI